MTCRAFAKSWAACLAAATLFLATDTCGRCDPYQATNWPLDPTLYRFPCRDVNFDGNQIVFRKQFNILCNGEMKLDLPAGSILSINAKCLGTSLLLFHYSNERAASDRTLFGIVSRQCRR